MIENYRNGLIWRLHSAHPAWPVPDFKLCKINSFRAFRYHSAACESSLLWGEAANRCSAPVIPVSGDIFGNRHPLTRL